MGLGMGAGLYDAAFATLGRIYGQGARSTITTLTLFGGFASTTCWPLSAWLVSELGWRGTCFTYAAIHLFVLLPIRSEEHTSELQSLMRISYPVFCLKKK